MIAEVSLGSFATGSSQQQARPSPLCRRKRKQIQSIGSAAGLHIGALLLGYYTEDGRLHYAACACNCQRQALEGSD